MEEDLDVMEFEPAQYVPRKRKRTGSTTKKKVVKKKAPSSRKGKEKVDAPAKRTAKRTGKKASSATNIMKQNADAERKRAAVTRRKRAIAKVKQELRAGKEDGVARKGKKVLFQTEIRAIVKAEGVRISAESAKYLADFSKKIKDRTVAKAVTLAAVNVTAASGKKVVKQWAVGPIVELAQALS